MIYKVNYDRFTIMPDGSIGNVSQGIRVAYMNCHIDAIENKLQKALKKQKKNFYPVVETVTQLPGEIIS